MCLSGVSVNCASTRKREVKRVERGWDGAHFGTGGHVKASQDKIGHRLRSNGDALCCPFPTSELVLCACRRENGK